MTGWAVFWYCLFGYTLTRYIIDKLTYNRNKAIKELAKEQYTQIIKLEIKKLKFSMKSKFDEVYDRVCDLIDLICDEKE